jgi:hypothetical protein
MFARDRAASLAAIVYLRADAFERLLAPLGSTPGIRPSLPERGALVVAIARGTEDRVIVIEK